MTELNLALSEPLCSMEHFEQVGRRAFYRPVGRVSFERGVDMIGDAVRLARELGLIDILVNTTGLTGYTLDGVFSRYAYATMLAKNAGSKLRVASVLLPEVMDPEKIGVVMARNRGVDSDVFVSEAEALKWLEARVAAGRQLSRHR
jgi:hypothetical protein